MLYTYAVHLSAIIHYKHNKGILLNETSLTFLKNYDVPTYTKSTIGLLRSDRNYHFITQKNVQKKPSTL